MQKSKQENHSKVIDNFLQFLNSQTSDYILKGGTALMKCYGLDRFSEDIDLDAVNGGKLKKIVEEFCRRYGFSARIAKNTDTVLRFMINYEGKESPETPLKIEVSFRNRQINPDFHKKINGIEVYDIDTLASFKAGAYGHRDKLRDLYDVCFICLNYWDKLEPRTQEFVRNSVFHKGFEQFDYLISTQSDPLIDSDKLASDYLKMYDLIEIPVNQEQRLELEPQLEEEIDDDFDY
jgi:predicted nucleotidyltransferase component of viral defense system